MKYFLFFTCLLFCSCMSTSNISTEFINVDEDYPEREFFASYTAVPLKQSSPMISEISDIRMSGNKFFISDKASRLFIFSGKGEFLNVLDKKGHGPNEYVKISDFDVKNDTIYILSRPQKKIYLYSMDGNHVETIELNDYYNGFRILSNNRICLASENSNDQGFNFIIFDIGTKSYITKLSPFSSNESMLLSGYHPFLGGADDILYISNPFSTIVMELRNNQIGWTKNYSFNTEEQLPETMSDYTFEEIQKDFFNKRIVKNLLLYSKTKRYEYVGYELFGEYGLSFYLTQISNDNGSKTMMALNDIDKKYPYISLPCCIMNQSLISAMSAARVLNIEHNYHLTKFSSKGLNDGDNPIIFIHKLK